MKRQDETTNEIRDGYIWKLQLCPICGAQPSNYVGKRGGASHREGLGVETEIWECCGLVMPNPMPFPVNGMAQHYEVDADEYFQAHEAEAKAESALRLVKSAEKLLGRKGRMLDVGVGRGETILAAKGNGWEVEGVEPSETFAEYAEAKTGVRIWRQPIEESDIAAGAFDVVILSAVLEHLYDPDPVVAKISSILKPGGLLFLDVPNESGLYFRLGNIYQRLRGRDWCVNLAPTFSPFHVFGFSPKSLKKLLSKHSLEPVDWKVYGGTSLVPSRRGFFGGLEVLGSKFVTKLSEFGEMGTYIETWARKN
jgi:2-polyprenyl-3-methyl-5-hydroxy-6-metoxy-1,4-benzoquinol methylase